MSGFEYIETGGSPIKAWTRGVPIEDAARRQIENVARLPFIHKHVAVMPAVHWGMGATVRSVIPTVGAIIPAAVGVDIGCGMAAVGTNIVASDLPDSLAALRAEIEAAVPHGRTDHGRRNDTGAWTSEPPAPVAAGWDRLKGGYAQIIEQHPKASHPRALGHLGTLGTGNHFVEICLDEEDRLWVMLHSGSRGVGNKLGTTSSSSRRRRCGAGSLICLTKISLICRKAPSISALTCARSAGLSATRASIAN